MSSSMLRQSFFALLVSVIAALFSGLFLGTYTDILLTTPGIFVLIPAAMGLRGGIFSTLGSRLGSGFHLGTLTEDSSIKNDVIKNNIYSVFILSVFASVFLGVIAYLLGFLFHFETISIFSFVAISFIGGLVAGCVLLVFTMIVSFVSYKKNFDPDNVTSPLITSFGDLFTIPCLLLAAFIVMRYQQFMQTYISGIILCMVFCIFFLIKQRKMDFRKIVMQSIGVICIAGFIDLISGLFIEFYFKSIVVVPFILILLPVFIGQGGNIGSILASRLATKLHIGSLKAKLEITKQIKTEFLSSYALGILVFSSVVFLLYAFGDMTGIVGMNIVDLFFLTVFAGIILISFIIPLSFVFSVVSFRHNINPDNFTIPLIASIADVFGVLSIVFVALLMGFI